MTVYRGFLAITRRNIHMMILYLIIFLSIAVSVQKAAGGNKSEFEQVSLNIAVIDQDGGELARGLADYLSQYHTLVDLPDDPSIIQDRIFYREVYYVVTIPEDFEKRCLHGDEMLPITKVPGSSSGFYVDQQINTFMNDVRIMESSGFPLSDAVDSVIMHSASKAEEYRSSVIAQLKKSDISVSIGMAITDPASDRVFDDYMKLADDEMYRVKVEKKEKGGMRKE